MTASSTILAQASTTQPATPPNTPNTLFFGLILMMVVFYIVLFRGKRKDETKKKEMLAAIKKNDRVMTIGGIIGVVVSTKDNEVLVKIDESSNTKVTFSRSAIQKVLTEEEAVS